MLLKILLLVIFFCLMLGIGFASKKSATNVAGFVLGGRNVGPWLTAFAYGTSYFSSVVFVGYAGQFGWKFGLASTWIGIGNAILGSYLAWAVLGRRTRVMTNHLKSATMPEFFSKRFESHSLKIASSVIIFVFLIPYTASIYNGLSRLFSMAFDIPYEVCIIAMALLTGVYVIVGGYMATAINDFVQGIIMLVGIVAVIWAVLNGQGGFIEAVKSLSEIPSDVPATMGQQGAFASFFGTDPKSLIGILILTSLGTWGLPQMVHKFYAIKDEASVKTGTIISTLFAVVVAGGTYFLGGFVRLFDNPAFHNADGSMIYDAIMPGMLSTLPDLLVGVVVVLVLSASMSTLSSLVLTSASTLTLDFIKDLFAKNMSEKKQISTMRIFIAFFIILSVVLAIKPPTFIAQLMGISWGALAGAFLGPFVFALYSEKTTKAAVWTSFVTGVGITVFNMFVPVFSSSITAGATAMIVSLIVVPIVSLFTPQLSEGSKRALFSCYTETVTVSRKHSIEESFDEAPDASM